MSATLRRVSLPEFGVPDEAPPIPHQQFHERARALYERAELDWVLVYGDREHVGNLLHLANFDPRFEEAVLILGSHRQTLIVGNEGLSYSAVSSLDVDVELCQEFSLLGQQRDMSPRLAEVLARVGLRRGQTAGLVGWKYSESDPQATGEGAFAPGYVISHIVSVLGTPPVDVTRLMMHEDYGLRSRNSAAEIAAAEAAASRASQDVHRVMRAAAPGVTEFEAASAMAYRGDPLAAHVMFASGSDRILGLRSPSSRVIRRGDAAFTAIGYRRGLSCRAGLVDSVTDSAYLEALVLPYFGAIVSWYTAIAIGIRGGEVHSAVMEALDSAPFRPLLNPGHSTSTEEWLNSPIKPGGQTPIRSGSLLQCDIIPHPVPDGYSTNCEDTIAVADQDLRDELKASYPAVWERVRQRQVFMIERLGLDIRAEILPLSSTPAYLAPFWLEHDLVCVEE